MDGLSPVIGTFQRSIFVSLLAVALVGCMGKRLVLPPSLAVPFVDAPTVSQPVSGGNIAIDEVSDARRESELVNYEGQLVAPVGESIAVTNTVRKALEETFQNGGLYVSDTAPVVISAELRGWNSKITGSGSPRADAEAILFLKVFDPANKMIYSGSYRGNANLQKVNMKEEDVREVLAAAMRESLAQISKDGQLLKLLSSF